MSFSDRKSYWSLIAAQFTGAFNDNCFKGFLAGFAFDRVARSKVEIILAASAVFLIPFILFSTHAGYLADRFSKRSVVAALKAVEVLIMLAAVLGFYFENVFFLIAVLFLLAVHSALFSPSKYGILPELLEAPELSRANGILELTSFFAIIAGTVASAALYQWLEEAQFPLFWGPLPLVLLAVLGWGASLSIRKLSPAAPDRKAVINPLPEIANCLRALAPNRDLRLVALGIAYFWSLGVLLDCTLIFYGQEVMGLDFSSTGNLRGGVAVGIGLGSFLAGYLSRQKAEMGLVPIGSLGMGFFSILMFWAKAGFFWALLALFFLGLAGGLFIVPLNVFLQQEAPDDQKGRAIAGVNVASFSGMLLATAAVWGLMRVLKLDASQAILVAGLGTVLATIYVFYLLPAAFFRFLFWLLTNTVYRIRIAGRENLPLHGPALLVANHTSFVDGLLILASTHRFIRFIVYKGFTEIPGLRWLARTLRVIPISPDDGPRQIVASLKEASQALERGELVCIFAEGQITRTGQLLPFRSGVEKILKGFPAPVIPVYLDRVWGSIFSFEERKFFWKWPRRLPYPVTLAFGKPLPPATPVAEIRQAVAELGSDTFLLRGKGQLPLPWIMVRYFRRRPFHLAAVDSSGARISRPGFLAGAVFLARRLAKAFGEEPMTGILLPPSVGCSIANVAASMLGKPAVNFNYTAGAESMRSAARQCGIRKVLTARAFLEKLPVEVPGEAVFLEDLAKDGGRGEKLAAAIAGLFFPLGLLRRHVGARPAGVDDLITVIFSSGSTGEPKGVELSHFNILSNIQAVAQVFSFTPKDCMLGVLPFFHSTGYTCALWTPLLAGFPVAYHPNPLDARVIGHLAKQHGVTMLLTTPTFLQGYIRRCEPGEFGSLRYVVTGAEKLTPAVRDSFLEKFGIEPLEGYGATECSPLISVNVPDYRGRGIRQVGKKPGIGHPLPGVSVRIVDPETFEPRKTGVEGLLLVKGPNVMRGYLGRPDLTGEVRRGDWYITGDIAAMDGDGFLTLTDRLARFAKIGGEMVPHLKVEEALHQLLEAREQVLAVTSIPDAQKGEKLAVVHKLGEAELAKLFERLPEAGLPNLWIPKRECFLRVDALPLLGTGKLDLRKIRQAAMEKFGVS
ncbi:MAG: MFS transporter [Planctomycetes bacterium]|nr:MFS transporter [Planctomycetota bacterium]